MNPSDCRTVIDKLARNLPPAPRLDDPWHLLLWENIGYLVDDAKRAELFAEFGRKIGLTADAIRRAKPAALLEIAKRGGMFPEKRVERWREIAAIVTEKAGGDLATTLKALPVAKARALLKSFPAIGDPGADKILLLAALDTRPALDSNGLRTLLRLGFVAEGKLYAASYKKAVALLAEQGGNTKAWFAKAYEALRHHGQTVCKRSNPLCAKCPLAKSCPRTALKGQY